jgi:hypothetical protein
MFQIITWRGADFYLVPTKYFIRLESRLDQTNLSCGHGSIGIGLGENWRAKITTNPTQNLKNFGAHRSELVLGFSLEWGPLNNMWVGVGVEERRSYAIAAWLRRCLIRTITMSEQPKKESDQSRRDKSGKIVAGCP